MAPRPPGTRGTPLALLLPLVLVGCGGKVCWFGCGDDGPVTLPVEQGCPDDGTVATWQNFGEGYFRTYCTPCHSSELPEDDRYGAPVGVDFDTYEDVVAQAALIKAYATGANPLMPPAGGPSDEDRELLREWIDCGLPGGDLQLGAGCTSEPNHLVGDLVVSSDADVADFCATYNGVSGDLQVMGAVDLDLDCVCELGGDLEIGGQARTVRLPELAHVSGSVVVYGASVLSVVELPALHTIDGDLDVADNPALTELVVPTLDAVGGSFVVENNDALGIVWPTQLERTGGDWRVAGNAEIVQVSTDHLLEIGGSFVLEDNAALEYMAGQAYAVQSVGGDILIRYNPALEYPELAFQELLAIGGDLEIVDNDAFARVDAFEKLVEVPGHLWIKDNDLVAVINGFDHLEEIGGSLDLSANASLVLVDGAFRVLEKVGETGDATIGEHQLRVQDNPLLASLGDLVDVVFVGGIVISGNGASFTALKGFHFVSAVGEDVEIYGNAGLAELDAFGAMTQLGGEYRIHDNPLLSEISGLYSIGFLPTSLRVERNPSLTLVDLGGAAQSAGTPLTGIGGDLVFADNDALFSLSELFELETVGGDLVLVDHAVLYDLTALHGLSSVGGELVVTGNTTLPTASAEALRDAIDSIGGTVTIEGNAP